MRVLCLSASDFGGGAGKVAFYLASGLQDKGVTTDMRVLSKSTDAPFVTELSKGRSPGPLKRRILRRLSYEALGFGSAKWHAALSQKLLASYDLIHMHDVPGIDLIRLWRRVRIPTVWTLHSPAAFTGNCLYPGDCTRWQQSCGQCPQITQWPLTYKRRDASAEVLAIRRAVYARMRFHAVGVSRWTADRIAESVMGHQPTHVVQNPSWSPDFYPVDRAEARARLGIPPDALTIMFSVAGKTEDKRKGLDIILAAAGQIRADWPDADRVFLMPTGIGAPDSAMTQMLEAFPGLPPRHIKDVATLRDYYSAASLIWHPSRGDTSSMVSLEAFGCGTPVIAAAVGGVPEIVQDGRSGLLIPPDDPAALVAATRRFADDPALRAQLCQGALDVAAEHSPERFVNAYHDIYRQAVALHTAKAPKDLTA